MQFIHFALLNFVGFAIEFRELEKWQQFGLFIEKSGFKKTEKVNFRCVN
jgi:hypothetical protein